MEKDEWIQTDSLEYRRIFNALDDELVVFSSYTDMEGTAYHWSTGKPRAMTEWGLKGTEGAVLKTVMNDNVWGFYRHESLTYNLQSEAR